MFEQIYYTGRFKKDYKQQIARKLEIHLLDILIEKIINKEDLDKKHKPHKLSGNYDKYWDCHIRPDWLLIWKEELDTNSVTFVRTGSHSDLF